MNPIITNSLAKNFSVRNKEKLTHLQISVDYVVLVEVIYCIYKLNYYLSGKH